MQQTCLNQISFIPVPFPTQIYFWIRIALYWQGHSCLNMIVPLPNKAILYIFVFNLFPYTTTFIIYILLCSPYHLFSSVYCWGCFYSHELDSSTWLSLRGSIYPVDLFHMAPEISHTCVRRHSAFAEKQVHWSNGNLLASWRQVSSVNVPHGFLTKQVLFQRSKTTLENILGILYIIWMTSH